MTITSTRTPLVEIWRRIIVGEGKVWALFERGTCVIVAHCPGDVHEAAVALLREWGPVYPGSPAGDFSVIELEAEPGWVVTSHHPDVLTYVAREELGAHPSELEVGWRGERGVTATPSG